MGTPKRVQVYSPNVPDTPGQPRPANDGQKWTREQLILALDLYCRIPWGQCDQRNPRVQALAVELGRTPGSVAFILANFGSFDPELKKRMVGGLPNTGKLVGHVWDEFHTNWGTLAEAADALRSNTGLAIRPTAIIPEPADEPLALPTGPSEQVVTRAQRLHQSFFRDAVLSSYDHRCCITGLPVETGTLVASHIRPWRDCTGPDEFRRADPTNGLCLSATFDRLFDRHLISLSDDCRLLVSPRLAEIAKKDEPTARLLGGPCRHGEPLRHLPSRFLPDRGCLEWHRAIARSTTYAEIARRQETS